MASNLEPLTLNEDQVQNSLGKEVLWQLEVKKMNQKRIFQYVLQKRLVSKIVVFLVVERRRYGKRYVLNLCTYINSQLRLRN